MPRFVPGTENVALDWLIIFASEPPVLNNSILLMLFVLATTENWRVASSAVLVSPSSVVNAASRGVFWMRTVCATRFCVRWRK